MKPKIIVSKNAGYCMGVKKAFAGSYEVSENHEKICTFGQIVHNRFASRELSEKKIITKEKLEEIIDDKNIENVIIRAHGIPPDQEKLLMESKKNIFDFTCPKVKQVQLLAQKLSNSNHTIILFGKKAHPEVIGILGYCKEPFYVIKCIDEAKKLPLEKMKKPALISQTTMNSITFNEICEFLKSKLQDIEVYNTLCNSPINIQNAAIELSKSVDAMIVVGDKMSANTTTLYEKIKKTTICWFVETPDDLNIKELSKYPLIGITGGSSTPQTQINLIKEYIIKNSENNIKKLFPNINT